MKNNGFLIIKYLWFVNFEYIFKKIIWLRKNSSFNWFTHFHVLIRPDVIWKNLSRPLYHVHFTVIHTNSRHNWIANSFLYVAQPTKCEAQMKEVRKTVVNDKIVLHLHKPGDRKLILKWVFHLQFCYDKYNVEKSMGWLLNTWFNIKTFLIIFIVIVLICIYILELTYFQNVSKGHVTKTVFIVIWWKINSFAPMQIQIKYSTKLCK